MWVVGCGWGRRVGAWVVVPGCQRRATAIGMGRAGARARRARPAWWSMGCGKRCGKDASPGGESGGEQGGMMSEAAPRDGEEETCGSRGGAQLIVKLNCNKNCRVELIT